MTPDLELAERLDFAIDQLIREGAWQRGPQGADATELEPLMSVAESVLELARRTPKADREQKERLWRRLERTMREWTGRAHRRLADDTMLQSSTTVLLRLSNTERGFRPQREVVLEQ